VDAPHEHTPFVTLPHRLYREYDAWVPPLISEEKTLLNVEAYPFFEHSDAAFFFARKDGRPAGRVAAIENRRHNTYHDERVGFFGFFDTVDDAGVVESLIEAAGRWVAERDLNALRGPASYSSNERWGALVDRFDRRPSVMMPFNPPYLPGHLEATGFNVVQSLLAYQTDTGQFRTQFLDRLSERVRDRLDLRTRTMDMARFMEEARLMRELYTECWSDNWGFVPPTEAEFLHTCEQLKEVAISELGLFAEVDGEEVGFIIGIPDVNEALQKLNGTLASWRIVPFLWNLYVTGPERVRVLLLGVGDAYRGRGIEAVLIREFVRNAVEHGYYVAELSWILESNDDMIQVLETTGADEVGRYHVYEKPVRN